MKIYTVYVRPSVGGTAEDIELVPEAFSLKGFLMLYNFVWAISVKCWSFAAMLAVFYVSFYYSSTHLPEYKIITANITQVLFVAFGIFANDFWRASLEKRGYICKAVIAAKNDIEASYKYFSNYKND
jgi:hypothetical protein